MNWDYKDSILDIYMPGYVKEEIHNFHHPTKVQPQYHPHQWNPPNYGSTEPQIAHQAPESLNLSPLKPNTVQHVVRNFLYYAHSFEPTMLAEFEQNYSMTGQ